MVNIRGNDHAIYLQVIKGVYLTKLYFYSVTIKNKIKLKK